MKSVDDIFDLLDGPAAVGRIISKSTEHAAAMKRRASIPLEYWPALIAHAQAHSLHLTSDDLVSAHTSRAA